MKMRFVGCWRFLQILKNVESDMCSMRSMKIITLLAPIVFIHGCSTVPGSYNESFVNADSAMSQQAPGLGDMSHGDLTVFENGVLASYGQIMIGREYYSASGRQCKKLLTSTGDNLLSVACKTDKENWYIRKPLSARKATAVSTSDTAEHIEKENAVSISLEKDRVVVATVEEPSDVIYRLEQNETLWSFAKRTTGNAMNWKALSNYNNVEDASVLKAGTAIRVPQSLRIADI